jgi:hypothetical protein
LAWVIGTLGGIVGGALLTFGLLIKTLQFVQAATVAVATVKTWYATVTAAAAAADGAAAAASLGDAAAKGVQAAATDMASIAATANAAAMTGTAAAAGGAAAASVTAGVTMVAAMLPVIGVLAAVLLAVLAVKYAWEGTVDAIKQAKGENLAEDSQREMEAKGQFQKQWIATHGTSEGWTAAWDASEEGQRLAARRKKSETRAPTDYGNEGSMDSIMAQAEAAMKQSEELQKSLPVMATTRTSTAQTLASSTASLSTLPTLGTAVAAPSVAVQAAQPLQLSLALDWGLIISNWSEISARHDWQIAVAPAY